MGYLTKATIDGSDYKLASGLYGTCSTPDGTPLKAVTCADFDALEEGVTIHVKFTTACSLGAAQLNVNSTGAKSVIGYNGTTSLARWAAGQVVSFTYDGSHWVMNDSYYDPGSDTKNTAGIDSSTSKMYLVGSTTAPTNSTNGTARTYANSKVYATDGAFVADSFNGVSIGTSNFLGTFGLSAGTKSLTVNGTYTLAAACEKGVDTSIASGSTSTNLPTTAAVADYVDSAVATATAGGLSYHGTASALTDITNTNYKKGWYWVADDSFSWTKTTGSVTETIYVDPGDMIIAHQDKTSTVGDDLDAVQSNIVALTTAEIDADWAAA